MRRSLGSDLLAGKKRSAVAGGELRKLRETTPPKLVLQPFRRHVDRRLRAEREREQRLGPRREYAVELPEERSNEPSANGSADASPCSNRTRPASSAGVFRLASASIAAARSTPTTSACGKRRASAKAPAPVPVPRSSALAGTGSTAASAASYGARCSGLRSSSQLPAIASNCLRTSGRKRRQRRGLRRTAFVATRANFRPRSWRFKECPGEDECPDLP